MKNPAMQLVRAAKSTDGFVNLAHVARVVPRMVTSGGIPTVQPGAAQWVLFGRNGEALGTVAAPEFDPEQFVVGPAGLAD